jgi:hypothetical protein
MVHLSAMNVRMAEYVIDGMEYLDSDLPYMAVDCIGVTTLEGNIHVRLLEVFEEGAWRYVRVERIPK